MFREGRIPRRETLIAQRSAFGRVFRRFHFSLGSAIPSHLAYFPKALLGKCFASCHDESGELPHALDIPRLPVMNSLPRTLGIVLFLSAIGVSTAVGQNRNPKPPDEYAVEFRYRIDADRNERIRQFQAMTKFLGELRFNRVVHEDSDLDMFDPSAERMFGTIPSAGGRALLRDPRIQTVLLVPSAFKPMDEKERVKVMLDLSAGFPLARQRQFSIQVRQVLESFGFQEAIAYDHRGYSRLRGTIPWVKVRTLLKDLRTQPAGWFLPIFHEDELPEPYKLMLPIRQIEVLPEEGAPAPVPAQQPLPPIPPDQPELGKLTAELRRYLLQEGAKDEKLRVEVTLISAPSDADTSWREMIHIVTPSAAIEGRLGQVVTVEVVAGEQVAQIARLPIVMSIRVPRLGNVSATSIPKVEKRDAPKKEEPKEKVGAFGLTQVQAVAPFDPLKATRLDTLHARGLRGNGYRVAIIDTDFTGYQKFLGRELPKTTQFVDLTAERNSEILPEPAGSPPELMGHGTHVALAVRYAAPAADIVLVRIAPDAPYQIVTAYRYMLGDFQQPESFRARREAIELDAAAVRVERLRANDQYRKAFDDFEDDEPTRLRRREAKAAIAVVEEKERAVTARTYRLLQARTRPPDAHRREGHFEQRRLELGSTARRRERIEPVPRPENVAPSDQPRPQRLQDSQTDPLVSTCRGREGPKLVGPLSR